MKLQKFIFLIGFSKYLPTTRFQFELVNPQLNAQSYDSLDSFATPNYDIDYLFASVMLSNPLFWMEMQFLSENSTDKLKKIIAFWKENREIFSECDASPIGERPSGKSFTGFFMKHEGGEYALVFREATDKSIGIFTVPSDAKNAKALISNAEIKSEISDGILKVDFSSPRSYALIKLS